MGSIVLNNELKVLLSPNDEPEEQDAHSIENSY